MACTHGKCEPPEEPRPLIALCVMVKNEEKILPRLLASVRGFADIIIALDTGSTDNTKWILQAAGADILEAPFEDFGKSRTKLMQFAKCRADWLLLMDADHTLQFAEPGMRENADHSLRFTIGSAPNTFREQLPFTSPDITAFSLKHAGPHPYWVPRLVRGDRDWKFVGSTHEYLDQSHAAVKLPDIEIVHHADGGARADKFQRDLHLLRQEVEENPKNDRAWFYLANTYRDLGLPTPARDCYIKRVTLGGWDEEVFMARLEAAKISRDPLEFWEAWASRPTRAEPLYLLEQLYRERGEDVYAFNVESIRTKIPVPEKDVLWVDLAAYASAAALPCWKSIPGWWGDSEEEFYKRLVALIPNNGKFVEVGTWVGRSFACFAYHAARQKKRIHQIAVDTFVGTLTEPMEAKGAEEYKGNFRRQFEANMQRCGVKGYDVLAMESARAAAGEVDASLDAVFLDGDHSTAAVDADLLAWLPKIKPGGYICGHDYDRESVKDAVRMYFPTEKIKTHGRCWIAQVV